jgi:predicted extracellular nuclease
VEPTQTFTVTSGGLTKETTTLARGTATLLVAEYNVENLDPGDGATKFARLGSEIAGNLNRPDIIALQEIQDNNGATNNGVVSADVTLQTLVDAIVAAGGPTYSFAYISPVDGSSGGEPGGNIRNAFLYDPTRVDLLSLKQVTDTALTAGDAFASSRIPLVGNFAFNGEIVTLINVHFSSKGGSSTYFGAPYPCINGAEAARINDGILAASPNAKVLVLGDHNEFSWEDAQKVLRGTVEGNLTTPGTVVLSDLADMLPERERYTYNFDGNAQSLDHTLGTSAAAAVKNRVAVPALPKNRSCAGLCNWPSDSMTKLVASGSEIKTPMADKAWAI